MKCANRFFFARHFQTALALVRSSRFSHDANRMGFVAQGDGLHLFGGAIQSSAGTVSTSCRPSISAIRDVARSSRRCAVNPSGPRLLRGRSSHAADQDRHTARIFPPPVATWSNLHPAEAYPFVLAPPMVFPLFRAALPLPCVFASCFAEAFFFNESKPWPYRALAFVFDRPEATVQPDKYAIVARSCRAQCPRSNTD